MYYVAGESGATLGLAIDFGTEWLKAGVVSSVPDTIGQHIDIVINEQSNRKTPALLGFDQEGERLLGEGAQSLLTRQPHRSIPQIKRLIGLESSDSLVGSYAAHWPSIKVQGNKEGSVEFVIKLDEGSPTVEEGVVMLLQLLKKQSLNHVVANSGSPENSPSFSHYGISIPAYWNARQRGVFKQLLDVAQLPNAHILTDIQSIAIDYATRNIQGVNGQTKVIFYSAGAFGVSVALVEAKKSENQLDIHILKHSSSTSIGGFSIDTIIRDHMAAHYTAKNPKVKAPIESNAKAMAKLLREAKEIKEMLSVSPTLESTIEELYEGKDFKLSISQEQFNNWIGESGLIEKFLAPLKEVLDGVDVASVTGGIELFGGAIRMPILQRAISEAYTNIPLGKHIDGEEAAVVGVAQWIGSNELGVKKLLKVNLVDDTSPSSSSSSVSSLSKSQVDTIIKKLDLFEKRAELKRLIDGAQNALEALINLAREQLQGSKRKNKERETLQEMIGKSSSFIEDADRDTSFDQYNEMRAELQEALQSYLSTDTSKPKVEKEEKSTKRRRATQAEKDRARKMQRPGAGGGGGGESKENKKTESKKAESKKTDSSKGKDSKKPDTETNKGKKDEL